MQRTARVLLASVALVACGSSERAAGPGATVSPDTLPGATAPVPDEADDGCPHEYPAAPDGPWVPAAPTTETDGRLVPDADPVEALVCRYGPLADGPAPLSGARALTGGLERIRVELHLPARGTGEVTSCPAPRGPRVPHLLRLRYADGELWLSAVRGPACAGTGNGAFTSAADLGERLAQAYDTATWPASAGRR